MRVADGLLREQTPVEIEGGALGGRGADVHPEQDTGGHVGGEYSAPHVACA